MGGLLAESSAVGDKNFENLVYRYWFKPSRLAKLERQFNIGANL